MRIALITPGFSASETDWCIPALLDLVRELAARHEVHVFTLRYPHQRSVYRVYGATVHAIGGADARGLGRLPLLLRALASITAGARGGSFDVIHGLWADEPGYLAVSAARLLKRPALVSLMGGELIALPEIGYGAAHGRAGRWLTRRALAGAGRVTVGSRYLQRIAAQQVPEERLALLPLGVDTRRFRPGAGGSGAAALNQGAIKLLHVASLSPVKDQALLLRALALAVAGEPRLHLHIVGEGPLLPDLRLLAGRLGIAGHVTFHGAARHEDLPSYYNAADLCLLSSRYESQSLVVLEAAACARTTIGTAVGLLPELAPAISSVPVGAGPALAEALLAAIADPAELAARGAAALALIEERYTLEATINSLVALYDKLRGAPGTSLRTPL